MINLDNSIANSDWIKSRTWDLPTNVKGFLNVIGGADKWEHFKQLPAYKAMPESLRHDVDAHVRAREAHKAYNPDQPRDELGRFGEMGTPQERLDRFNSKVFVAGQGVVLKGKELREQKLKEMQAIAQHRQPWLWSQATEDQKNSPEWVYNNLIKEEGTNSRWGNRADFDNRVLGSGFIYSNGPIQMQFTTDRYLKDGGLDLVVASVERLQESNPLPRLDIRVGERNFSSRNAWGAADLGGNTMWLSPGKLLDPKTMNESDPGGNVRSGWWMPAAADTNAVNATVTHEWGHLIDRDTAAKVDWFTNNEQLARDNSSRYGIYGKDTKDSGWSEMYAEFFMEYNLSGGKTANPAVQEAAKAFKW